MSCKFRTRPLSERARKPEILCAALLIACAAVVSAGEPCVLQNGDSYKGTTDTYLYESAGKMNYGKLNVISVGRALVPDGGERDWKALLRFDLSVLAGQKAAGPATLDLVQVNTSGGNGSKSFRLGVYEVSSENADWAEGIGANEEATEGERSWDVKAVPSTKWAGKPGLALAGMDHDPAPVAEVDFKESDGDNHVVQIQIPAAVIQKRIDHPEMNGGLLFAWESGDDYLGQFRSSEFGDATKRPLLQVEVKP